MQSPLWNPAQACSVCNEEDIWQWPHTLKNTLPDSEGLGAAIRDWSETAIVWAQGHEHMPPAPWTLPTPNLGLQVWIKKWPLHTSILIPHDEKCVTPIVSVQLRQDN